MNIACKTQKCPFAFWTPLFLLVCIGVSVLSLYCPGRTGLLPFMLPIWKCDVLLMDEPSPLPLLQFQKVPKKGSIHCYTTQMHMVWFRCITSCLNWSTDAYLFQERENGCRPGVGRTATHHWRCSYPKSFHCIPKTGPLLSPWLSFASGDSKAMHDSWCDSSCKCQLRC